MKSVYAISLLLICCLPATAQIPPVCTINNPPMGKQCNQACILCELDGYSSATTQTIQGQQIPGYCTQVVHSMGYMGFVAGSTNLSIQVDVGPCTQGNSIEMGIYQTDNCQDFTLVSDCNTAMFTGNSYVLNSTEPLVPGCPYFIVTDNNGPAACAFTITVVNGSGAAPAVGAPAVPAGPNKVCPGSTVEYTIPPLFGACQYRWTAPAGTLINGQPSPAILKHDEGTTVTVTWGNTSGQLCVSGSNPCSQGPTACLPVMVSAIPPTVLPTVRICNGDSYEWIDGNIYVSTQLLSITYVTPIGCDSMVNQQLIVDPPIISNIGVIRICEGDCAMVGNGEYCTSGFFQETIQAANGCDSTIFFSVLVIEANAAILAPDTLSCTQDTIVLDGKGSTQGSIFIWQDSSGQTLSNADTLLVGNSGLYRLIIERTVSGITCRDTAVTTVFSNKNLPDLIASGDSLTCADPLGQLSAQSNTPGVSFTWTGPGGFQANIPDTTVSVPGLYNIVVAAPNGCSISDTVEVTSNQDTPLLTTAVSDTLTCSLDSVLISAQSSLPGTAFLWSGPQNFSAPQADTLITAAGLYTLLATAPNGCTATDSLVVLIDTLPPLLSVVGDTLTCQQTNGQLTASFTPANAVIVWSGPQNFSSNQSNPIVSLPGNYTAEVTAINGCQTSATALVEADTVPPQLLVSGGTITCTQPSINLNANFQPTGSAIAWSGPQSFSSNIPNPPVNNAGTYLAVVTAPNGCTTSASTTVAIDTITPQLSATGDTLTCTQNAVSLNLSVTPVASTVLWSGPGNFSSTQTNPSVTEAGVYTVMATAPNGCTATTQVTVEADASIPQVSVSGGTLTCAQPTINLSATVSPPGSTISWTGPQNFSSGLLNPVVSNPGQYTLLATTANGCTASATTLVSIDTLTPSLTLAGGTLTCTQPMLNLSAIFNPDTAQISWVGPAGFTSNLPSPAVSAAGNYTATVTAANGCTSEGMVTVLADMAPPVISAGGGTITCSQPNVQLASTVNPVGSALLWSGPQSFSSTQSNPQTNLAGTYTLVATAANGCTASTSTMVSADTLPPQLTAAGATITCAQPIVSLSSAVVPANAAVLWSGPQNFSSTSPNPAISEAGNYTITATGTNGCTSNASVQVSIDTLAPQVSASGGLLTCLQNTLSLNASISPTSSAVSWSGPQGFTSMLLNPVVSVAGTYTVVATSANGCTASATAIVTADSDFPVIQVAGGTITCNQPTITLSSSVTPGGSILAWSGPAGFMSGLPNPDVSIPGNYTLTATTAAGCSATATVAVLIDTIAPQLSTTAGGISCAQPSAIITATVLPANSTVFWSGPQNFSATATDVTVNLPGQYNVTATAPNGCTATSSAQVSADTVAPQIQASGGLLSCQQPQLQLSLSLQPSGSTVLWTGPQNFSSTQLQPNVSLAGTYTVTATAPNGCTATATTVVTADQQLPQVQVSGGTVTCAQPTINLGSNVSPAGGTLAWMGPQNFSSNQPTPAVVAPGMYTLTVSLPNGCTASATTTVNQDITPPLVDAFGNDITCREDSTVLEAVVQPANSSILWTGPQNFSSTQALTVGTQPGTYTVVATAPNGCTQSAQVVVAGLNQPTWSLSLGPDLDAEEFEPIFPHPITDLDVNDWAEVRWEFPAHVLTNQGVPCTTCKLPVIKLAQSGAVTVYLTDPNGCTQTATYFIRIQQTSAIYVPNIFYPESEIGNQRFEFHIGAEARVVEVREFRIFDRWGSLMHERPSFLPDNPDHGWDGKVRGKEALPGVYVWYAEFEFANGRIKLLKGDVTLYR